MALIRALIVIAVAFGTAGCRRDPAREYELRGQIVSVNEARQEVTIRHEDIPRFMPGMTMPFKVGDQHLLEGRVPGDLVRATLVVKGTDAHLRTLERTGFSPLDTSSSSLTAPDVIAPGDSVADASFIDETGTPRRLEEWRGRTLAVTFIYTRCPLPNFCPLMDRHFKEVQERIRGDGALAGVQLLSISFDPRHDTPAVLAKHAAMLQADPERWRFLTGEPEDVERFANQFGVSIMRSSEANEEIVHNLRTAVIDSSGRLVTVLNGAEWRPSDLIEQLRTAGHGRAR